MPIPSIFLSLLDRMIRCIRSISAFMATFGSEGVLVASWLVNFPLTSAKATVICVGRISTPMITRSSFKRRNVGRRPRGRRPVGPSNTHISSMSCSTIREIVLRCNPDTRAKSAREIGCLVRMRFRTMRRLMPRTTSLDAP